MSVMKRWTVYYRDVSGAKTSLIVEADDRNGVFSELRKRGISAISISEGEIKNSRKKVGGRLSGRGDGLPPRVRGLIAVLVVIIGAGAAVWFMFPKGGTAVEKKAVNSKTRIKHVSNVIKPDYTNKIDVASSEEKKTSTNLPPQKVGEVRNGMVLLPNGKLHRRRGLKKISSASYPRSKYSIFPNATDNELAALLMLKPGDSLIGGPIRYPDYKKSFLKSLETPIVVKEDDADEIKDLKRAVLDARKSLKQALDEGQDITEIIKSAYDQAHELATYKEEVDRQVKAVAKEGDYTDDELNDIIKAANAMLEKKGIAPIRPNPLTRARLKILKK